MKPLDLYAKIEPLIGFYEEYERLYDEYIDILNSLDVNSCLDIGCGNGKFLKRLSSLGYKTLGIERSEEMVKIAKSKGVDARILELCDIKENSFDIAFAIGDVLNYMTKSELESFFIELYRILKKDAYFLADINTLYGFEEITSGIFVKESDDSFVSIEADFEESVLETNITFFKKEDELYKKFSDKIFQYYHTPFLFENISNFKLLDIQNISMFSDEIDKNLLILQKI